ncbi:trna selenocysteine 1-associated protein 1-related [Citrus sinensis]|nr:trna selenocysteine 1-associated protein 1-related [Citrus sinensis]
MATAGPQGGGYHQHHHPMTLEEVRTLWIGDLQYWFDENYLSSCFAHTGEVVSIKIIRNKITGQPEGYGFVEFVSHAAAERVLQTYNGTPMPGTEQNFRLNWASFGIGEKRPDAGPEHSIFVGDLAPDVTDYLLQETFRSQYPSVRGAKVVTDPNTGRSKGYGFVKFLDENERNRAMTEMNGVFCSTRPMRISAATPKKTTGFQQQYAAVKATYPVAAYTTPVQVFPADNDITNTTIFVGNLDPNVTEEELKQTFLHFGEIVNVKIPMGRGCGFVQFAASVAAQVDPSQWNAYYGYGQGYDAYAYGAAQDPSLYAYGAYAGYPQYAQQAEGVTDMAAVASALPTMEQREELYDPLATPDVDK